MKVLLARLTLIGFAILLVGVGVGLAWGTVDVGRDSPTPRRAFESPVTAMDHGRGVANNSPGLVADPTDERLVVMANRLDAPDFGCALQVSGDGGRTWRTANPVAALPTGADKCYAPEAAFDAEGTLYYLFVGLQGDGNQPMGAYLTTSADRTRTFTTPRRVLGPRNYAVRMALDRSVGGQGRIHLVWLHAITDPPLGGFNAPPNPILSAHSDDGGRSFSTPVPVNQDDRQRVVAPALALGPRGEVHVAYYDLGDDIRDYQGLEGPTWEGTWAVVVASSTVRGRRFGPGRVIDDGVVPHERVQVVFTMPPPSLVAGDDGRLCAAWTDARQGDPDAVLRCSADGGRHWGGLRRLNDDAVGNGKAQYQPRLAIAPGGRLDVVFYDRRADPDNVLNEVAFTSSTDGALSFAPNRMLTSDPSNTTVGQRYAIPSAQGLVEFGSRIALLSTDRSAVAAWTDTRNSRGGTGQDVFSAWVGFPDGDQPGWAQVVGIALVAGGLVSAAAGRRVRRSNRRDLGA